MNSCKDILKNIYIITTKQLIICCFSCHPPQMIIINYHLPFFFLVTIANALTRSQTQQWEKSETELW